jgi:hypothetical protein
VSCGAYKMTAGELYDSCSIAIHVPEQEHTAEQKIQVAQCKSFASRVFYDNGYIYVGWGEKGKTPQDIKNQEELKKYCPSQYWDAFLPSLQGKSVKTPDVYLVQYWDKNGMSYFERNLIGAESSAKSVFKKLFPQCSSKRAAFGIPKVTGY